MYLSFNIDPLTLSKLKKLAAKAQHFSNLISGLPVEEKLHLHTQARISTIGASTRIENAVLTDAQVSWIDTILTDDGKTSSFTANRDQISNKLSKDRERSLEEVAGCREMLAIIYEQTQDLFPFSETNLRALHHEALKYFKHADYHRGQYKLNSNSVVERGPQNRERIVLETTPPGPQTEVAISDLVSWYNDAVNNCPWITAVGAEFVFRFLAIHPFQDGNGRLGRALFLVALGHSLDQNMASLMPYLAIDRQIERSKQQYYTVLAKCSGGQYKADPKMYRIEIFHEYMLKMVDLALDDIEFYRSRFQNFKKLSETAMLVVNCFKDCPEQRLSIKTICEILKLPRRSAGYALATLTEQGFIQKLGQGAGTRYQLIF